jgi:DNA-binding XRE family transcriptional regulator
MNRVNYLRDALGLTQEQLATALDITTDALSMHESGLKKLSFESYRILEILYLLSKYAAENRAAFYSTTSQDAKQKCIKALLEENEAQQKVLIPQLSLAKNQENQQLTRQSLLVKLTPSDKQDDFWKNLSTILANSSQFKFEKEHYNNQLKLRMLKYERRVLEQDLQKVIDNMENLA